jgi:nitrogen fixation protein FixH
MAYFYINMSHEKIELVGENYYADGQAYQAKINLQNQAIPAAQQIQVKSIANDQFILIQLPTGCDSANVQFFRPSNAAQDKTVKWISKDGLNWTFPTDFLVEGPWKRSISWSVAGKSYLQEDRIFISKK